MRPTPRDDRGKRQRSARPEAGARAALRGKLARAGVRAEVLESVESGETTWAQIADTLKAYCRSL